MTADPTLRASATSPDGVAAAGTPWSHRDHAAQPARALGPKAGLLHSRRLQRDAVRTPASPAAQDAMQLTTRDAEMTLVLKPCGSALYVERIHRRAPGTHVTQSMVFACADEFTRWCNAEPLRFDDPVLHQCLCRRGLEFFGGGH